MSSIREFPVSEKIICSRFDHDRVELNIGKIPFILSVNDARALRDALSRCLDKQHHPIGAAKLSKRVDRRNLRRKK